MNTMFLKIALPLFFLLGASLANANDFYIATGAMQAEGDADFDETGYSVALGKYVGVSKRVSVEVGYTDFGESEVNNIGLNREFEASAVQLSTIGYLPLSQRVGVYGRVGVERVKTEASINTFRAKSHETNPYIGFGGYFNVTEDFDIRVEYQRHEVLDEDLDTYNAGITVETF